MNAFYAIRNCCGRLLTRIKMAVPTGCSDPSDFSVRSAALALSGYDGDDCTFCDTPRHTACFDGYVIPKTPGAKVSAVGKNRDHLIETLETVIRYLRVTPEHTCRVECSDERGCIK